MNKSNKQSAGFDILLVIFLILSVSFNLFQWTNYVDDLIAFYFLIKIFFKLPLYIKYKNNLNKYVVIYLLYSLIICFAQSLPATSYIQIFITSKFLIFFYYFNFKPLAYKDFFYRYFVRLLSSIFILSIVISIFQFVNPDWFGRDYRGLNGVTLLGLFQSRTLFSSFLVFLLIYLTNVNRFDAFNYNLKFIKYKSYIIPFILILVLLTFTRKDLVFALGYFMYTSSRGKGNYRYFLRIVSVLIIVVSPLLSKYFFGDINKKTFVEDQIRTEILVSGTNVFKEYFPFGSGPGTFGSIMSMEYQEVYKELNVPERIYLGYEGDKRGPIFDVFVISLLAEYGLGIILFAFIFYHIYYKRPPQITNKYLEGEKFKKHSLIYILLMSLTVPIFNNLIGLLFFSFFGLISESKKRSVKTSEFINEPSLDNKLN